MADTFWSRHRAELRRQYGNLLTSGINIALLLVGLKTGTRQGWILAFSLVAVTSLIAWMGNFRRFRMIADTPTSKVASAPQGYVELFGHAALHPGVPFFGKLSGLPCVWCRYQVEEKNGDKWNVIDWGATSDTFLLVDGSGQCVVDPDRAEIVTTHRRVWTEQDYRLTEYRLIPGDTLYAIGEHVTLGGANSDLSLREDVNALLAEWKKDRAALLERFDLDKNGEVDIKEWELARQEAVREVRRQHLEIRLRDGVHVIRHPRDKRMFLISNLSPQQLARKYVRWAWFHLLILLAACGGAGYNLLA